MKSEFPLVTVEELSAKRDGAVAIGPFGSAMKADCYVPSGVPVIRGANVIGARTFTGDFKYVADSTADQLSRANVFEGDLVFPHRGAIGEVGLVPLGEPRRWMLSTSLMKLSCDRARAIPEYVYYFFRSPQGRHELLQYASTVGTPGIGQPLTSLKSCRVPLPPLKEQKRIAAVLGALDDKIELNRKVNQTLEEMAQAIFKSWFIDFDGVPEEDLVDSELGPIPRGWDVLPASELVDVDPSEKLAKGTWTKYLPMTMVSESGCSVSGFEEREYRGGTRFRLHDTLLARITPCLENGKTALVDFLEEGELAHGSTEYIVLRAKRDSSPFWVYCLARNEMFRQHAINNMTGTTGRQRVPREALDHFLMAEPPAELVEQFHLVTQAMFARIRANSLESATLADLRDTLLPKLISGEVRVPEAEAQLEMAL